MGYLKTKYKKATLLSHCVLLLLKNVILIKILKLKYVSLYDRIVIEDNEIEILWSVKGCHKIKIKDIGVFPGDINGLKFHFSNRQNPIEITFYGIAKKIKKKIKIKNTKIDLLCKFIAKTEIPIATEVYYSKQNFQCELINDNLEMEFQTISFEFEPFNIDNYKPVIKIQ
jgi:hypothetical protein